MADMTPADMMALTGGRENGFLEGNGIIILILFFLMFGWGGGAYSGNASAQGALTRAEMNDGFNMAELQRNQSDIKAEIGAVGTQVLENRYAAALQAQTAQAQMASCCCDLKTAIHAEGEATRALIQQNQIDDLKQQLNTATAAVANATQTQNILSQLGRYVTNPSVNPYTCYGGCGCA